MSINFNNIQLYISNFKCNLSIKLKQFSQYNKFFILYFRWKRKQKLSAFFIADAEEYWVVFWCSTLTEYYCAFKVNKIHFIVSHPIIFNVILLQYSIKNRSLYQLKWVDLQCSTNVSSCWWKNVASRLFSFNGKYLKPKYTMFKSKKKNVHCDRASDICLNREKKSSDLGSKQKKNSFKEKKLV